MSSLPESLIELTNLGGVIGSTKDKLRGTIIAGTDIRDIWFVCNQNLCTSEIAKLENASTWIKKKVLWLDVPMANTLGVYVCEGAKELVDVYLDLEDGHCSLHFVEEARSTIYGLWHEL